MTRLYNCAHTNEQEKKKMLKKEILTVQLSLDQTFTPKKPKFKYLAIAVKKI